MCLEKYMINEMNVDRKQELVFQMLLIFNAKCGKSLYVWMAPNETLQGTQFSNVLDFALPLDFTYLLFVTVGKHVAYHAAGPTYKLSTKR